MSEKFYRKDNIYQSHHTKEAYQAGIDDGYLNKINQKVIAALTCQGAEVYRLGYLVGEKKKLEEEKMKRKRERSLA